MGKCEQQEISSNSQPDSRRPYLVRLAGPVVALLSAFLFFYLLQYIASVLLVVFGGILFAVFLHAVAQFIAQNTPVQRKWAVLIVLVLLFGIFILSGWFAGPRIVNQLIGLVDRIPEAVDRITSFLSSTAWGQRVLDTLPSGRQISSSVLSLVERFGGSLIVFFGSFGALVIATVIGIFIALSPSVYLNGVITLLPSPYRTRAQYVFETAGRALRRWLVARIISMVIVGALTAAGLFLIGMPLWFALALIAGLLSFIPYLGPVLSYIPAILVALGNGPLLIILVTIVYAIVQLLESYAITPFVEQETTTVPAALLIVVQVLFGTLMGFLGILLASPLAVFSMVLIQLIYVEDMLGDKMKAVGEK